MADLTITVANVLTFVGMDRASLWGTAVWGTDTWGAGSLGMEEVVGKLIANTVTGASTERFDVVFNGPVANTLTLTSAQITELLFNISTTLNISSAITSELLTNGIWYYVWRGGATDHDDEVSTTYASASSQSSTYSSPTAASTTWS